MFISLHTPKAGGSSFKKILETHFESNFLDDYKDKPINKSFKIRKQDVLKFRFKLRLYNKYYYTFKNVKCIHGHFMPYKYDYYLDKKNIKFITWLRDPIDRLASHYYYWLRSYNKKNSAKLHRKIIEENWSFEKFAFSIEMKNIYCQFLWRFPIDNFDFIGIVEYFNEDVNFFCEKYLKKNIISVPTKNQNLNKTDSYYQNISFINELKQFHSEDYKLYHRAINLREKRLNDIS